MSRLSVPSFESAASATADVDAHFKKGIGNVPNTFAAIGAHGPGALKAVLAADAVLASGTLTKRDQETSKLVISVVAGCHYGIAAQGKLARLKPDELKKIGDGERTGDAKRPWSASSARSRKQAVPLATISSRRLGPRRTPTRSWWTSVLP